MKINFSGILKYVEDIGTKYILNIKDVPAADAIMVLGAYVYPNGTLSSMLNDRLSEGYELYKAGKAAKILVSGDHDRKGIMPVSALMRVSIELGISLKFAK